MMSTGERHPQQFLTGIVILDFSQYIPGPYASLTLSDLGAAVIKIEPPAGDPMRAWGPLDSDGISAFYKVLNSGKRICRVDLKDPENRAGVLRLVADADILIESFRPGVLERLGLDRAALKTANPNLIHCAISGYGQTGPYRDMPGHDLTYMALTGALGISGLPDQPVMTIPPVSDYAAGLQAAVSVLAAVAAPRSGGVFIDIGISDAVLAWQSCALTGALRGATHLARGIGEESGGLACYRIYRAGDGRFITLAAQEPKFWAAFCRAVGRIDWIDRQWERVPQLALITELDELFASAPAAEWDRRLSEAQCCYQRVLDGLEVPAHQQIRARKMLVREGQDERLEALYPAWIDGAPPSRRPNLIEVALDELLP